MVLVSFMTAPFVANVFIQLPTWARKSKDTLGIFLRSLPPDTRLEFHKMGFLPMPRTRTMQLSELRPLSSKLLLANLEQVPRENTGKKVPTWLRAVRGYLWTRPTRSHWEKTLAPEVWPAVMNHVNGNAVASGVPQKPLYMASGRRVTSVAAESAMPTPRTALPRAQSARNGSSSASKRKK